MLVSPYDVQCDPFAAVLNDASHDVFLELMGGTTDAKDVLFGALSRCDNINRSESMFFLHKLTCVYLHSKA